MTARSINTSLQTTVGALCVAALAILVSGIILPLEKADDIQLAPAQVGPARHAELLPPVSTFTPLFAKSLQAHQGQIAAAQIQAAPADNLVPITQLVLIGTVGTSLALIKGPDGSIGMVETGEDVNGSPVIAIRPAQVDLRVNGKLMTLRMPPPPDDTAVLHSK